MHKLTDEQLRVLMFAAAHWEDELRQYVIPASYEDGDDDNTEALITEADKIGEVLRQLGD